MPTTLHQLGATHHWLTELKYSCKCREHRKEPASKAQPMERTWKLGKQEVTGGIFPCMGRQDQTEPAKGYKWQCPMPGFFLHEEQKC
jgi:hypothetical protein